MLAQTVIKMPTHSKEEVTHCTLWFQRLHRIHSSVLGVGGRQRQQGSEGLCSCPGGGLVEVLPYDYPPCLQVHLCVDLPGLHGTESSFVTKVLHAVVTSRPHPELSCGHILQPFSSPLMKCRNMAVPTLEDLEFVAFRFPLPCSAVLAYVNTCDAGHDCQDVEPPSLQCPILEPDIRLLQASDSIVY